MRRVATALALVVALALVAVVVALRSLDRPWLKRRIVAVAHARTGLDVDWTAAHVALFSGLRIDQLVVRTPPALRGEAPELVRADGVTVSWTLRSLVAGTPRFGALAVDSLALTLVRDAAGRTSLSTIEPHGDGAPAPAVPGSRLLAGALDGPPPIARVDIARATVTVLAEPARGPKERFVADGLALHATLVPDGRGFAVAATLGTPAAPLVVDVTRTRDGAAAGEARARLWAEVTASPAAAAARLDVAVERQTLAPATRVHEVAHLEASARFGDGHVRVAVAHTRLADGAATVDGELELPDGAAPRIERAEGDLDLPRLLAIVPSSLVPVAAERARLRYRIAGDSGTVEGELGRVRVDGAGGAIVADGGKIIVSARPDHGATLVHAIVPLDSLTLPGVTAAAVHVTVDARVAADRAITGDARVRYGDVRFRGEGSNGARIAARDGELGAHVEELRVDTAQPIATRGLITLTARAANVDAAQAATHAVADGLGASVRARLRGEPPYAVDAELPIAHLKLSSGPGRAVVDGPVRVAVRASDVRPDAERPLGSRGRLHANVALGALTVALDADKAADAVDFKVRADAASLAVLRPLVPRDATIRAPWDKMSLTLASDGRIERFAQPSLREHTTLALTHAALDGAGGSVAADRVEVDASSSGNLQKHEATVAVRTRALRVDGAAQGDAALQTRASFDSRAPSMHLVVSTSGDKGPLVSVDAAVGFDRARRAVTYDLAATVARLSTVGPLVHGGVSGFDFDDLAVDVAAKGALAGLVHDVDKKGAVHVVHDPLRTLAAAGTLDVAVSGLDWSRGDRELEVPHARWHAVLASDGAADAPRRLLQGTLTVDSLTLDVGDHEVVFRDVRDDIDGTVSGDLRAGVAELDHRLAIKKLTQDLVEHYRTGDLSLDLKARRDADGVLHIAQLTLGNRVGGTTLSLHGALDVGAERRSLSVEGELVQDLSRPWGVPMEMRGRGRAAVQLRVDSGDLRVYHTRAAVRVKGATIELPKAGVTVESMDGEIPLSADVVADARGVHLLRSTSINAYSELRFADQHPLLGRPSFVSIARVATPWVTLAPLAGNLRVDDNIVSLNQLEVGVRGGRVTGQCIVDWREDGATVQTRIRASDVKSSHGEPFDGNAALVVSTRDRNVDGRAEILRIGKRHLLDLLDLHDPHHADPAINRIRRALALGYPDHVRLTFKHGFADAKIDLGGLARLFRIDELHGIPMGPIVDKIMSPMEHKQEDEEE